MVVLLDPRRGDSGGTGGSSTTAASSEGSTTTAAAAGTTAASSGEAVEIRWFVGLKAGDRQPEQKQGSPRGSKRRIQRVAG